MAYQHQWDDGAATGLSNGKVVCVGRNYADHIKELNSATPSEPVLFIKPSTALRSGGNDIEVSHLSSLGALHHEAEISLLIGRKVSRGDNKVVEAIHGIGIGLDLTLRDVQSQLKEKGLPWERAKAFDGSCVLSPFVRFDESIDLAAIDLILRLNGKVQQHGNSAMMLYAIPDLLINISQQFTLEPGDVVLTGTPAGVGPLKAGDQLTAQLNGLTLIENANVI